MLSNATLRTDFAAKCADWIIMNGQQSSTGEMASHYGGVSRTPLPVHLVFAVSAYVGAMQATHYRKT